MNLATACNPDRTGAAATSLASVLARKLARALAAVLPRRSTAGRREERHGSGDSPAHATFLARAQDAPELERRQRAWDRTESNAFSLSNWS